MVGLIGILIALIMFLVLVYKGWSSYWVAPLCAIVIAVFNLMSPEVVVNSYVTGLTGMIESIFFVVFFGAILGKIYNDSGAAASIAKGLTNKFILKSSGKKQVYLAVLVCLIVEAVLTMGGIDGYVLTFTFIPIALVISEMVDIPRRYIGGLMVLNCAFMACPGAPQVDNILARAAILGEVFGENSALAETAAQTGFNLTSTAAPIPGLVAVIIILAGGYFYLCRQITKAKANGEHFEWGPVRKIDVAERKLPGFFVSFVPLIVVFCLYTLVPIIFHTEVHIAIALGCGIVSALLLFGRNLPVRKPVPGDTVKNRIIGVLNDGSASYPGALLSLCTPAALAGVVTATTAFGLVVNFFTGIEVHPYILALIAVCVLVAITSSPPAALMITLPIILNIMLAKGFAAADVLAMSPGIMRIGALATTTFETLPFNGLIVLTLNLIGCTHKEVYKPMLVQSVIFTLIGSAVATLMLVAFPGLA